MCALSQNIKEKLTTRTDDYDRHSRWKHFENVRYARCAKDIHLAIAGRMLQEKTD
jgi:hypothetical protein